MGKRKLQKKATPYASIPADFQREMADTLGVAEAEELVRAIDSSPTISVRLNVKKSTEADDLDFNLSRRVEWCRSGYYIDTRPDFTHDPLLHAGAYYVQEAASMIYESLLWDILPKIHDGRTAKVLDMCAAPGGKSTAMLNALEGDYLLVANEFERKRVGALEENLAKWGDGNVIVTNSDTALLGKLEGYFDVVGVDAPCSGEGMMRRSVTARSQWSEGLVEQCVATQREILRNAYKALRPGGYLIYSTCTFNSHENEGNVNWLTTEFNLEFMRSAHFMPHRVECEGLFVALLKKSEGEEVSTFHAPAGKPLPLPDDVTFINREGMAGERIGDTLYAVPERLWPTLQMLKKAGVRIVSAGVEVANFKGASLIPSSKQALSLLFDPERLPAVELDREASIQYLKRLSLSLPASTPTGYVVVTYRGRPLGLMKNIGTRANNLYPQHWKIIN